MEWTRRAARIGAAVFGDVETDAAHLLVDVEHARPVPHGDGDVDRGVLRRDGHHLAAAPGDGAHIAGREAVLLDHELLGRLELVDAVGNLEIEQFGRLLEPLGMLAALEDLAAIGALALEHAGAIVQAMARARAASRPSTGAACPFIQMKPSRWSKGSTDIGLLQSRRGKGNGARLSHANEACQGVADGP